MILISVGWLAVVFFTLSMCRAGARSDESQDRALREWIAAASAFDNDASTAPEEQPALYPEVRAYREAG